MAPQPVDGEAVGRLKQQFTAAELPTPRWADPRLEGGFAQAGLQFLLDLIPQLFPTLPHRLPSSQH
jgi:hypothetical protein